MQLLCLKHNLVKGHFLIFLGILTGLPSSDFCFFADFFFSAPLAEGGLLDLGDFFLIVFALDDLAFSLLELLFCITRKEVSNITQNFISEYVEALTLINFYLALVIG